MNIVLLTGMLLSVYYAALVAEPRNGVSTGVYVPVTADVTVTGNLVVLGTVNGLPVTAFTGLGNATSDNIPNTIVMRDATASFDVTNIAATGTINAQTINTNTLTVANDLTVNDAINALTVTGNTVSGSSAVIFPAGVSDTVVGLQLTGHPNTGFWAAGNVLNLAVNGTQKFNSDGGTVHLYGAPLRMYGQSGQQILLQADSTINMVANGVAALDVSSTQITAHVPINAGSVSATSVNSGTVSATTVSGSTVSATGQVICPAGSAGSPGLVLQGIANTGFYTVGGVELDFKVNNNTKFNTDGGTFNIYGNPINLYGGLGSVTSFPAIALSGVTTITPMINDHYTIPDATGLYMMNNPTTGSVYGVQLTLANPVQGQIITIVNLNHTQDTAFEFPIGHAYRFTNAPSSIYDTQVSFSFYYNGSTWYYIGRS